MPADIKIRATMEDDTKRGAAEVAKSVQRSGREASAFMASQSKREVDYHKQQRQTEVQQKRESDDADWKNYLAENKQRTEHDEKYAAAKERLESRYGTSDAQIISEHMSKSGFGNDGGGGGGHAEGGGGHGAGGRIFSDQKTTGLDPLGRGLVETIQNKLGLGLKVGATAVVGKVFADVAEKSADFSDQLRRGETDAKGVANAIATSIPVLGEFVSGFNSVREAITGEKLEIERTKDLTNEIVAANDRYLASTIRAHEVQRQQVEALREMKEVTAGIGLRGSTAERYGIQTQTTDAVAKANLDLDAAKDRRKQDAGVKAAEAAAQKYEDKYHTDSPELKANLAREAKRADADMNRDIADAQSRRGEAQKQGAARLMEFDKQRSERLGIESETAGAEHRGVVSQVAAEGQRTGGDVVGSRKTEIDAATQIASDQATIAAKQRSDATSDADEKKQIASELGQKLVDIEAKKNADIAAADKEARMDRERAAFDANRAEIDAATAGTIAALQIEGRGFEAGEVQRKAALKAREAEIDQRTKESIEKNKANAKEIQRQGDAQKQTLETNYASDEFTRRLSMMTQGAATPNLVMSSRGSGAAQRQKEENSTSAEQAKFRASMGKSFADAIAALNRIVTKLDGDVVILPMSASMGGK